MRHTHTCIVYWVPALAYYIADAREANTGALQDASRVSHVLAKSCARCSRVSVRDS